MHAKQLKAGRQMEDQVLNDFVLPFARRPALDLLDNQTNVFAATPEELDAAVQEAFDKDPEELANCFWKPVYKTVSFEYIYNPPTNITPARDALLEAWRKYISASFVWTVRNCILKRLVIDAQDGKTNKNNKAIVDHRFVWREMLHGPNFTNKPPALTEIPVDLFNGSRRKESDRRS